MDLTTLSNEEFNQAFTDLQAEQLRRYVIAMYPQEILDRVAEFKRQGGDMAVLQSQVCDFIASLTDSV